VAASAGYMECCDASILVALDAGALLYFTNGTNLRASKSKNNQKREGLTSFHLCFGILSVCSMGSINVGFPRTHSGTQIAHNRWAHFPLEVCLNAPPSFGHNKHSTRVSGDTVHFRQSHCPSGIYGTP
jgi:hypothetical protein